MSEGRVRRQAPRQPVASRNEALCLAPPEEQGPDQATVRVGACAARTRPRRAGCAAARRMRARAAHARRAACALRAHARARALARPPASAARLNRCAVQADAASEVKECSLLSSQASTVLGASRPGPTGALRAALTHLRAVLVGIRQQRSPGWLGTSENRHAHHLAVAA